MSVLCKRQFYRLPQKGDAMRRDKAPVRELSDHLKLWLCIYQDAIHMVSAVTSDLRDITTVIARTEREGMSFLTITLPDFARGVEHALAAGYVDPAKFRSFRKSGAIPAFLQGMLGRLFSQETGRILDETKETPILVESIRQICLVFKKVELGCTPDREAAAIQNFVDVEQAFDDFAPPQELLARFASVSDVLWQPLLRALRPDQLAPRHGPGATAERIMGNQKFVWRKWYDRLERVFPLIGNGYTVAVTSGLDTSRRPPSDRIPDALQDVSIVPVHEEDPVRVTLVPKTLKAPRVIAIEPVCMQFAQQALRDFLYGEIEKYWLTKGHVNFTDQSVNQLLALAASRDGRLATIDLSDASDRVPYAMAKVMFRGAPDVWELVDACRSTVAELPDGRLVGPLKKFASMGSALCFPVEAMYFYTACVEALLGIANLPVTPRNVFYVSRDVYVYGDDIIVPADVAEAVLDRLREYNCKVNSSKSFWTGKFRESCGVDAYAGYAVTPVYLRRERPQDRRQAQSLISWVKTGNAFYQKGYYRSSSYMLDACETILGAFPEIDERSPALGRITHSSSSGCTPRGVVPSRTSPHTHELEIRAWVPEPVYRSDGIDGYPALWKSLSMLEGRKNPQYGHSHQEWDSPWLQAAAVDERHLERSVLRGEVKLKRRWVPATSRLERR